MGIDSAGLDQGGRGASTSRRVVGEGERRLAGEAIPPSPSSRFKPRSHSTFYEKLSSFVAPGQRKSRAQDERPPSTREDEQSTRPSWTCTAKDVQLNSPKHRRPPHYLPAASSLSPFKTSARLEPTRPHHRRKSAHTSPSSALATATLPAQPPAPRHPLHPAIDQPIPSRDNPPSRSSPNPSLPSQARLASLSIGPFCRTTRLCTIRA